MVFAVAATYVAPPASAGLPLKLNDPGAVPKPVMSYWYENVTVPPPAGTTAEAGDGYPPCFVAVAPAEASTVRFAGGVTVRLVGLPETVTCMVTVTEGRFV